MAARVLANGLEQYRVGERVRRLRLRRKISLKELGRHAGLSPALLSKLERHRVMPTLPTLMRIALALGVGLETFFVRDTPGATVTRSGERVRLPERLDDGESTFDFECLDFGAAGRPVNAYFATFRPTLRPLVHTHEAAELLFVTTGSLDVLVDGVVHCLETGDAICIRPSIPHGYAKRGEAPCTAVVVTTIAAPSTPAG